MFDLKTTFRLFIFMMIVFTSSSSNANTTYKIKASDNLNKIVNKFYKNSKLSRHQIYIGLLAENPDAFRYGNINYLKSSKRIVIPKLTDLLAMEKKDATNLVTQHNNHAKQAKKKNLPPPFENYSPKSFSSESNQINTLAKKQQATSEELVKLDSETEALRIRLEQLAADKEAMDAELNQLDNLLKE